MHGNGTFHEDLAARLREIRVDLYGEHGVPSLADALGVPPQTWLNYETGVMVPAHIVLQLIVMAEVNPRWLLTGQGGKYARGESGPGRGTRPA